MAAPNVVLFDVFQTLVDFDGDHVDESTWRFLARWLAYRGRDHDPESLEASYRRATERLMAEAPGEPPDVDVRQVWALMLDVDPDADVVAEVALTYRQITTRRIRRYDGTIEVLDALSHRRLGIVSNTQRAYTEAELEMLGLLDRFEAVVFSSDVRVCKPHPAPLERALELLQVDAGDCVFVGDNPHDDVRGARGLGIPVVLLDRGHPASGRDDLIPPDAVVPGVDPVAVVEAVEELLAR